MLSFIYLAFILELVNIAMYAFNVSFTWLGNLTTTVTHKATYPYKATDLPLLGMDNYLVLLSGGTFVRYKYAYIS